MNNQRTILIILLCALRWTDATDASQTIHGEGQYAASTGVPATTPTPAAAEGAPTAPVVDEHHAYPDETPKTVCAAKCSNPASAAFTCTGCEKTYCSKLCKRKDGKHKLRDPGHPLSDATSLPQSAPRAQSRQAADHTSGGAGARGKKAKGGKGKRPKAAKRPPLAERCSTGLSAGELTAPEEQLTPAQRALKLFAPQIKSSFALVKQQLAVFYHSLKALQRKGWELKRPLLAITFDSIEKLKGGLYTYNVEMESNDQFNQTWGQLFHLGAFLEFTWEHDDLEAIMNKVVQGVFPIPMKAFTSENVEYAKTRWRREALRVDPTAGERYVYLYRSMVAFWEEGIRAGHFIFSYDKNVHFKKMVHEGVTCRSMSAVPTVNKDQIDLNGYDPLTDPKLLVLVEVYLNRHGELAPYPWARGISTEYFHTSQLFVVRPEHFTEIHASAQQRGDDQMMAWEGLLVEWPSELYPQLVDLEGETEHVNQQTGVPLTARELAHRVMPQFMNVGQQYVSQHQKGALRKSDERVEALLERSRLECNAVLATWSEDSFWDTPRRLREKAGTLALNNMFNQIPAWAHQLQPLLPGEDTPFCTSRCCIGKRTAADALLLAGLVDNNVPVERGARLALHCARHQPAVAENILLEYEEAPPAAGVSKAELEAQARETEERAAEADGAMERYFPQAKAVAEPSKQDSAHPLFGSVNKLLRRLSVESSDDESDDEDGSTGSAFVRSVENRSGGGSKAVDHFAPHRLSAPVKYALVVSVRSVVAGEVLDFEGISRAARRMDLVHWLYQTLGQELLTGARVVALPATLPSRRVDGVNYLGEGDDTRDVGAIYFSDAAQVNDALVRSGALVPLGEDQQRLVAVEVRVPSLWERELHDLAVPVNLPRLSAYPIMIRHGPREVGRAQELWNQADKYVTVWATNGVPSTWNGDRAYMSQWAYAVKLGFPDRAVSQAVADQIEAWWLAEAPVTKNGVQYVRRAGRSLSAQASGGSALDLKLSRVGGRAYFVFHIYIV